MPPMTGRVIAGRYNLQHPIGRGAMGVVWRARDQLLDRDVAVKELAAPSYLSAGEQPAAIRLKAFHSTGYEHIPLSTGKLLSNMQRVAPNSSTAVST